MKKYLLLLFLIIIAFNCFAQKVSFGPSFGSHMEVTLGENVIDSMVIVSNSGGQEGFGGVFIDYKINNRIRINNRISYYRNLKGFIVYNKDAVCQFCPIEKTTVISYNTFEYTLLPSVLFSATKWSQLSLFAGPTLVFNLKKESEDTFFPKPNYPGYEEVINNLDDSPNPFFMAFSYGASLEIKRVILSVRYFDSKSKSFTKELKVYGKKHAIYNREMNLFISLEYRFFFKGRNQ